MKFLVVALLSFAVIHVERSSDARVREAAVSPSQSDKRETPADRDRRMQWWREARFGMFIHWGLYAVPAGEFEGHRSKEIGEWIMSWANIPRARYEKFAAQFNPVAFDAAEWVRIAKKAGMKYIVITSKHHDGFSMFDSKVSAYDIVDATPYRKDPMRALADEAKKQGLRFCFYYLLSNSATALTVTVSGERVTIQTPTTAPDPIASIVVLETTHGASGASNRPTTDEYHSP